jgi:competence protein ComEA
MRSKIISKIYWIVLSVFTVGLLAGGVSFAGDAAGKVNINQATVKELSGLPGIGKKKAEAVVAYRKENGAFTHVDDIRKVEGIGKKTLEKIRGYLTVEGG